jgi:hypothetical protein
MSEWADRSQIGGKKALSLKISSAAARPKTALENSLKMPSAAARP